MADFKKPNAVSRHTCHHLRREQRRLEASERQALRDRLTAAAQVSELLVRPGASSREIARLVAKGA